ncbi:MAG: hypothetical protein U0176_11565 [Bacteroidia bacterium]
MVQAEYYWDTDPGQGNGIPLLALDGNLDEMLESVYQNGISMPITTGPHTFNVRVLDNNGSWSSSFSMLVQRLPLTGFNRATQVTQAGRTMIPAKAMAPPCWHLTEA